MFYEILLDIGYLVYYMNNVINPFVYYAYLKNFQEGYLAMLGCKTQRSNSTNTGRSIGSDPTLSTI